jgi:hypothetical protein
MKWKPPFRGHSGTLAQASVVGLVAPAVVCVHVFVVTE